MLLYFCWRTNVVHPVFFSSAEKWVFFLGEQTKNYQRGGFYIVLFIYCRGHWQFCKCVAMLVLKIIVHQSELLCNCSFLWKSANLGYGFKISVFVKPTGEKWLGFISHMCGICQELWNIKAHETRIANFIHLVYCFTSILRHTLSQNTTLANSKTVLLMNTTTWLSLRTSVETDINENNAKPVKFCFHYGKFFPHNSEFLTILSELWQSRFSRKKSSY